MVVISRFVRAICVSFCVVQGLFAGDAVDVYRNARSDAERLSALGNLRLEVIHGGIRRKLGGRFGKDAVAMRKNIKREMDVLSKRIVSDQRVQGEKIQLLSQQNQAVEQELQAERGICQTVKDAQTKGARELADIKRKMETTHQEIALKKVMHEKEIVDLNVKAQEQRKHDAEQLEAAAKERDAAQKRAEDLQADIKRHEQEAVAQKEVHDKELHDAITKSQEQRKHDAEQLETAAKERDAAQKRAEDLQADINRHEQEAIAQKEAHDKELRDAITKAQEQRKHDAEQLETAAKERDAAQKRAEDLQADINRHEQEAVAQKEAHEKEVADLQAATKRDAQEADKIRRQLVAQREASVAQENVTQALKKDVDALKADLHAKEQRVQAAEKAAFERQQAQDRAESARVKLEAELAEKNKAMSDLKKSAAQSKMGEAFKAAVTPGGVEKKIAAIQKSAVDKHRIDQLSSVVRAQKSAIEGLNQKIIDLTRPTAHVGLPGPAAFPAQTAQKSSEKGVTQRVINKLSDMFEWFKPSEARERLAAPERVSPVREPVELTFGESTAAPFGAGEPIGAAPMKRVTPAEQPEAEIAGFMFKQLAQEDPSAVTKLTGMLAEKVTAPERGAPLVSSATSAELIRGLASGAGSVAGYLPV